MKKIAFISFILILSLTGCGNTISSSKVSEEPKNDIIFIREEPMKKPVEEPEEPIEEPKQLINSPETPCGAEEETEPQEDFSLPNIEDYFSGEDFFDLESYLVDCGAECIGNDDCGYIASFPHWDIIIGSKTYSEFPKLAIENDVEHIEYYYIPPGEWETEYFHKVNDDGLEVCDSSIGKLPDVIYALYEADFAPENLNIYRFVYD